jgi:Uncharacterized protein conserved in bacteria
MTAPYDIRFTREAVKDAQVLTPKLKAKLKTVLEQVIAINPAAGKALAGDLKGFYSYRLTIRDRIVYTVSESEHIVYIHRARTHYGD